MKERIASTGTPNGVELVVEVTVVDQEQYDGGAFVFDGTLDRVSASLSSIRELIPEEYRAAATCEISSVNGYEGSHYASIVVTYRRPATPDESAQLHKQRGEEKAQREAQERATLAALQAKYAAAG